MPPDVRCTKFDFCWGSAPDPAGRAYSAPPDPSAVFKGPTSKGTEWQGKGGKGRGQPPPKKKYLGLEPPLLWKEVQIYNCSVNETLLRYWMNIIADITVWWVTWLRGHLTDIPNRRHDNSSTRQLSWWSSRRQRCKNVAHTRLSSVRFRSWSRFFAVSLQVTWVINPAVGCHYFPPGLQLPSQPLRGLLPISLLGEQRHKGVNSLPKTFTGLRFEPWSFCAWFQHANHSATEPPTMMINSHTIRYHAIYYFNVR